ncbi:hypothetical protein SALBM135S_01780 [Streptomyces alboniger]
MVSRRVRWRSTDASRAGTESGRPASFRAAKGLPDLCLGRERRIGEVAPDGLVLPAGKEQYVGVLDATARAPDLLVVRDRRGRRAEVDHEAQVGLVEAHAERRRRDQRLDAVLLEVGLGLEPVGVLVRPVYEATSKPRCRRKAVASSAAATVSA